MSSKVECPVCGRFFGTEMVSEHVNSCLSGTSDLTNKISKKRKSGDWDFLTKPNSNKANAQLTSQSAKIPRTLQSKTKSKVGSGLLKSGHSNKERAFADADDNSSDIEIIGCNTEENLDLDHKRSNKTELKQQSTFKPRASTSDLKKSNDGDTQPSRNVNTVIFGKNCSSASTSKNKIPLAERMRPLNFDGFIGQESAVGKKSLLHTLMSQSDNVPSMVLWGPPGCGKTTLAKILAQKCKNQGNARFVSMSATSSSVNDVRETAKVARNDLKMLRRRTILFIDEIHRFTKTQQDALLPHIEDGTFIFIGATTENPSFHVNAALLSRCRLIVLEKLQLEDIKEIIKRSLPLIGVRLEGETEEKSVEKEKDRGEPTNYNNSPPIYIEESAIDVLAGLVDGDARTALNGLQLAVEGSLARQEQEQHEKGSAIHITMDTIKEALQRSHILYDKTGEEHYNTVSALIKSLRGSDASAALYWMTRMIEGGESPLFVARRLVIFASEDVGMADPLALNQAVATYQACHFIGMPECALNLAQGVIYLARAPKSVEVLKALQAAKECVRNHEGALPPVPLHLRQGGTSLMRSLGYGKGYKYPPDFNGNVKQDYFPPSMVGTDFFSAQSSNKY